MQRRLIRSASNGLLVLAALAVCLALLEAGLRLVDPKRLVPNVPANIRLNEMRNELAFHARNRDRKPEEFSRHDPWLGWDASYDESRVRGGAPPPRGKALRMVALGDSFVYGNEVEVDENFAALLNRVGGDLQVLNMGVPGYGLDQAFLKYQRFGMRHRPDIVLFGIYVSDYERAVLRFTAAAKPRFELQGERMVPAQQPVPEPATVFARIDADLREHWRLILFVRNRLAALATDEAAFFDAGDRIARHVLTALKDGLGPNQRLLVLHIPRGESFTDPDPFHQTMAHRLLALYRETGVPFLDLSEIFLARTAAPDVAETFYVIRESGSIGHLNPAGHDLAARAIRRTLGLGGG